MKSLTKAVPVALVLLGSSVGLKADNVSGTVFYTTFASQIIGKVTYSFTGGVYTLGSPTTVFNLASHGDGGDGLLFLPDGNLAAAGQANNITEATTGGTLVKNVAPGSQSFHLALSSNDQTLYTMCNGGCGSNAISAVTLTSGGLNANGNAYTVSGGGGDLDVRGVIYDPNNGVYYYGTAGDSSTGSFGTVVFNDVTHTATLTRLLTGVPAHGLTFDPFTGDIIFSSGNLIDQFDPTAGSVVSTYTASSGAFDQSSADGKGHLLVSSNDGNLWFLDYDATGKIGTASFVGDQFLAGALDDIAPLSGSGSPTVPEPTSVLLLGTVVVGVCYRLRRRSA